MNSQTSSKWPQLDSSNCLNTPHQKKSMIRIGIPTCLPRFCRSDCHCQALQVVALVASPVLRSALSHDTLHCPAASSLWMEPGLVPCFGFSIQRKYCSFNKILHNILKNIWKKTQSKLELSRTILSNKFEGEWRPSPLPRCRYRPHPPRGTPVQNLLWLKTDTHISIQVSRIYSLKEMLSIVSCTFQIWLFVFFWTCLNPRRSSPWGELKLETVSTPHEL